MISRCGLDLMLKEIDNEICVDGSCIDGDSLTMMCRGDLVNIVHCISDSSCNPDEVCFVGDSMLFLEKSAQFR